MRKQWKIETSSVNIISLVKNNKKGKRKKIILFVFLSVARLLSCVIIENRLSTTNFYSLIFFMIEPICMIHDSNSHEFLIFQAIVEMKSCIRKGILLSSCRGKPRCSWSKEKKHWYNYNNGSMVRVRSLYPTGVLWSHGGDDTGGSDLP